MTDIAVSGPVSIKPEHRAVVLRELPKLFGSEDVLVTGGAYGVDSAAAVWALSEGLPVTLVVPRSLRWHRRLALNRDVVIVEVDGSYMDRNEEIAERAAQLAAFPFTKREHMRSGTWATVRRFQARAKPVKVIALATEAAKL